MASQEFMFTCQGMSMQTHVVEQSQGAAKLLQFFSMFSLQLLFQTLLHKNSRNRSRADDSKTDSLTG